MCKTGSFRAVTVFALVSVVGLGSVAAIGAPVAPTSSTPTVAPLITTPVSDTDLVTLRGNTHRLAQPGFDQGLAASNRPLERLMLLLGRSAAQDEALSAFNERQSDPSSPDYHHWLSADEFGRLYGPADADVAAITSWLESHGFRIDRVNTGKVTLEFSGTVAQVQDAFHVQMHNYLIDGVQHIANDRDPQIPRALAQVVAGIVSLNDFRPPSLARLGPPVERNRVTGKITPVTPVTPTAPTLDGATPEFGYIDGNGYQEEDLGPYDFATVYNSLPLWKEATPIIGTGVTVAIVAGSDISSTDVATFRSTFGLPAKTFTTIHNGTDPGSTGDKIENTLDVEMVGAAAPGANIDLVVSAATATSYAFQLSMQYIVSNQTAPIMSASYGICELDLGTTGNQFFNSVTQQGATEGISIFISAGDQGSAGCDGHNTVPDAIGLAVNGLASTPYVTAIGGTDLNWPFIKNGLSTYWNSTADANGATAKGYIPEGPWNSTCANPLLLNVFGSSGAPEFTTNEALCNAASTSPTFVGLTGISGGSGGVSSCTAPTGKTASTCTGGYAKPSWQTGTGVPADGKRDVPDVSLFSAGWFNDGIDGTSAILFCYTQNGSNGCDYSNPDYVTYQVVEGTSAASPYMAGVMAMIEQKVGSKQGLINPTLYKLAAQESLSACNSSSVSNGSSCIFYDITSGNNAQACFNGDRDCVVKTSGDELGILSGYTAAKGYDQATGLGSVNITNLVNAWTSSTPTATLSVTPSSLTFASTTVGSTAPAQTVTVKNTSTVAVSLTTGGITISGTNASSYAHTTTCGTSLAVGASCTISVTFKPTATGTLTASLSIADNASGSPQTVSLTGTGASATTGAAATLSPTSLVFPSTITATASDEQVVALTNTGTSSLTISAIALSGTNPTSFVELTTCGASLAAGASCSIYVAFDPTTTGALPASLTVTDNATGSPQKVTLSGTGTAAPSVKLSPTTIAFPTTTHATVSAAQPITVTNAGTAALDLTSIALTGTNPADFEAVNNCGPSLAAGTSCTIYVAFKPAAAASYKASISVADNGSASPQTVSLSGTGK
jgi:subtilase family serine protease